MNLYELIIGFRYLRSKKADRFISFNTALSVAIVFIGVFTLIVVISVMNGFQSQIKDKILDVDSHITVIPFSGNADSEGIPDYREITEKIRSVPGVVSALPYLQGQALVRVNGTIDPVIVRGFGKTGPIPKDFARFITEVDKENHTAEESEKVFTNSTEIYIGSEMALTRFIRIGDYIELIVPKGGVSARIGMLPGIGRFRVKGFFNTGYYDYDTKLIIMSLPQSQKLFAMGDRAWGIGIKIKDIFAMDQMSIAIQKRIGYGNYQSLTAEERNASLFYALRLEKLIMTIILLLVVVSAGFTIMGTMVMVVMEKRKAVGILKSMGARPNSIMIIFVLEGFFIGVTGTILGVVLGLATSTNLASIVGFIEKTINTCGLWIYETFKLGIWINAHIVPDNVYYIKGIPTEILPEFVVIIAAIAVCIATISAIFPAWSASRLRPVETIRYE